MTPMIEGDVNLERALQRAGPTVKQFLYDPKKFAALAAGFRCGKSVIGCAYAILKGYQIPNGLTLIGRLNMPALKATTQKTFLEMCPREWVRGDGEGWKATEQNLHMKNGHEYIFRHLDLSDAALAGHIRSLNLSGFLVDQAEEITEGTYLTLEGRLSRPPTQYGRLLLNPAGHDWIWSRFFDPERSAKWVERHAGYTLSMEENKHNLPPNFMEDLLDSYPLDWRDRFIYGSFADFSDLVFKEFDYKVHVYDSAKAHSVFSGNSQPPPEWPIIVGTDIGGVDPWAIVFIAVEPNTGNLFVYDEVYAAGILIEKIAAQWRVCQGGRELEGHAYDYENKQAAMELAEHGIGGTPAIKDVMPGIFKVGQYLHPNPALVNPFTGNSPSPRLFIASNCVNTIREVSTWKWAKDKRGQPTGKPDDVRYQSGGVTCHWDSAQALRYAIHTFRPEPVDMMPPARGDNPDLDMLSRMYWRDMDKKDADSARRRMLPGFARETFRIM